MIENLNDVIKFYEEMHGRALKRWELNRILDKFNYDKERLFAEASREMKALGETGSIHVNSSLSMERENPIMDDGTIFFNVSLLITMVPEEKMASWDRLIQDFEDVFAMVQLSVMYARDDHDESFMHYRAELRGELEEGETIEVFKEMMVEWINEEKIQATLELDEKNKYIHIIINDKNQSTDS